MSDHALLSPSSSHRWMVCPGSVGLTKDLPDIDTVYSREGMFAHSLAAELLLADGEPDAATLLGRESDPKEFTCDSEMADAIQVYLNAVRGTVLMSGGTLLVEQPLFLTKNVYGTGD